MFPSPHSKHYRWKKKVILLRPYQQSLANSEIGFLTPRSQSCFCVIHNNHNQTNIQQAPEQNTSSIDTSKRTYLKTNLSPTFQICSASSHIFLILVNSSIIHKIPKMKCGNHPFSSSLPTVPPNHSRCQVLTISPSCYLRPPWSLTESVKLLSQWVSHLHPTQTQPSQWSLKNGH